MCVKVCPFFCKRQKNGINRSEKLEIHWKRSEKFFFIPIYPKNPNYLTYCLIFDIFFPPFISISCEWISSVFLSLGNRFGKNIHFELALSHIHTPAWNNSKFTNGRCSWQKKPNEIENEIKKNSVIEVQYLWWKKYMGNKKAAPVTYAM